MANQPSTFSLKGFINLIRWPNLLILVFTQYLGAIFLIGPKEQYLEYILDPKLFLLVLGTAMITAAGYIINDYYDVKIDEINKPERVVVGRILKRRVAMFTHTALSIAGIGLGLLVSWKVGAINSLAAFLLWWYSNRLKRLPLVGNVVVSFLTALALGLLAVYFDMNQRLILIYAVFAFFISLIREMIKDMEDLKGDATFGCRTLPVVWGIRKTKLLVYLVGLIFAGLLMYLAFSIEQPLLIYYFLVLLIPTFYLFLRLAKADTVKEFSFLSRFCKILMLCGVISMMFL
ncbi:MAG: geranylgeranylglycerol-phosphate geranylgeranyltransferase [Cyclobacteriaceae bacterium]